MEIRLSCKKLLLTRQNKWKMTIVNEGDKKIVLNYIKTQEILASPIDGLKTYLYFFPTVNEWRKKESRCYFICFISHLLNSIAVFKQPSRIILELFPLFSDNNLMVYSILCCHLIKMLSQKRWYLLLEAFASAFRSAFAPIFACLKLMISTPAIWSW